MAHVKFFVMATNKEGMQREAKKPKRRERLQEDLPDGHQRCMGECSRVLEMSAENFYRHKRTGLSASCKMCDSMEQKAKKSCQEESESGVRRVASIGRVAWIRRRRGGSDQRLKKELLSFFFLKIHRNPGFISLTLSLSPVSLISCSFRKSGVRGCQTTPDRCRKGWRQRG